MSDSFNVAGGQWPIPSKVSHSLHKRPILTYFLLCLAIVMFTMQNQDICAQEGGKLRNSREHDIDSVATCCKVPYGALRKVDTTGSQSKDVVGGAVKFVTSPNPDGPVLVDIGLYIVAITAINEIDNTFRIEAFMDLVWCDPRLAFIPEEVGVLEELFLEEDAKLKLAQIWWPDIQFVNQVGGRNIENEELIIHSDGSIEYEEKFTIQLEAHYDLRKFPFDRQVLEIEIESFAWSSDYLVFHLQKEKIGFSTDFEIPEWHTVAYHTEVESVKEIRDRAPFSEVMIKIEVVRQYGYYVWKILMPLVLIVLISWVVFWMIGEGLSDRMGISFTAILTIVAYQFLISGSLPRIAYFTFMDSMLTISLVLIVLTIFENVFVNSMNSQKKQESAIKIDKTCRWAFPLIYGVSFAILALIYLR